MNTAEQLPQASELSPEELERERQETLGDIATKGSGLEILPNGTVVTAKEHEESVARGEEQTNQAYENGQR